MDLEIKLITIADPVVNLFSFATKLTIAMIASVIEGCQAGVAF
jgi:hypothetical protein